MNLQSNEQSNCFNNVWNIHQCAWQRQTRQPHSWNQINEHGLATEEERRKKNEMDEMLAQALSGLTCEERQQHQNVLHGVDERTAEEASLIDDKLEELDLHLMFIKEGSIYEVAERQDAAYVHDRSFRIMFLRANEYDGKAAADQMIRFFESKCELFGESKLTKDITMKDLDEDDMAALASGWAQYIGMDQSGRQIWAHIAGVATYGCGSKALMSHLRAQYFFVMRMLQSEETQLRGSISLWYAVGNFKNKTSAGYKELHAAAKTLPRKTAAVHLCVDDLYQYAIINVLMKIMKGDLRARFRVHFGSQVECQYQLATFGIRSSLLPIDSRGRLDLTRHRNWLQFCAMEDNVPYSPQETSGTSSQITKKIISSSMIVVPNEDDVLFGDRSTSRNAGNMRFRALVQDNTQAYADLVTDEAKRELVATIIDKVHASGGRFLRQSLGLATAWEEVPSVELRKRIMQSFRNRRRLVSCSKQVAMGPSSGVLIEGEPRPSDVIFGRVSLRTPGTELLNRLMKESFNEYESLDRGEKMKLVEVTMQAVKDGGGRFLQTDTETFKWMELSHEDARRRISKYFRNLRRYASNKAK